MKKAYQLLLGGVALVSAAAAGLYFYCNVNMTGKSYEEILAFQETNPNRAVHYTVTIDGDTAIQLDEASTDGTFTAAHLGSLLTQAEYLQGLTALDFAGETLSAQQVNDLTAAFPNAAITCASVSALGHTYDYTATAVDLSDLTADQIPAAADLLQALPMVETVELCKSEDVSTVTLEDANALHTLYPDAVYNYRIELFGQVLTTDMEQVEYFKAEIGDEGLEQFKLLLPMMHKLTYFKLDWCGTSDEAMDALRTQYQNQFKVVWRIFFGYSYNALTDTYKLYANQGLNDKNTVSVKYCNEVRYLDFGHSGITHCEWVRSMPDLEVCILSDSNLKSLEPLTDCPKLEFLEFFFTRVTDLTPVAEMEALEYLNISKMKWSITDISPLYALENLKQLHITMTTSISKQQVATFQELHPHCKVVHTSGGDATGQGWRRFRNGHMTPRYALLRQQIGYDTEDFSKYPTGYSREIITYESTGIAPPEVYNANE